MKNRPFRERLGFAVSGIRFGWIRERSFRVQTALAIVAALALLLLRPPAIWWGLVALTIALVLALELVNSAVEALVDLLHPAIHPEVKAIKDMMAGAVLLISIAALGVGGALLFDRFILSGVLP
ncbi:diacylglycerol kinase [Sphingomonas sp. BGYR3]|uniref:diacylglycerol kinase n=1 Tax=Sphingomonas sp. BGYR3 TaxID=2975483 RepID=UPI0021A6E96C|nr:diacylglycerol kinase [Sphingomonas sp. BGYR3]